MDWLALWWLVLPHPSPWRCAYVAAMMAMSLTRETSRVLRIPVAAMALVQAMGDLACAWWAEPSQAKQEWENWVMGTASGWNITAGLDVMAAAVLVWNAWCDPSAPRREEDDHSIHPEDAQSEESMAACVTKMGSVVLVMLACTISSAEASWMLVITLVAGTGTLLYACTVGKCHGLAKVTLIVASGLVILRYAATAGEKVGFFPSSQEERIGLLPACPWERTLLLVGMPVSCFLSRKETVNYMHEGTTHLSAALENFVRKASTAWIMQASMSIAALCVSCWGMGKLLFGLHLICSILIALDMRSFPGTGIASSRPALVAASAVALMHSLTMCVAACVPVHVQWIGKHQLASKALRMLGLQTISTREDVLPVLVLGCLASMAGTVKASSHSLGQHQLVSVWRRNLSLVVLFCLGLFAATSTPGYNMKGWMYVAACMLCILLLCFRANLGSRSHSLTSSSDLSQPLLQEVSAFVGFENTGSAERQISSMTARPNDSSHFATLEAAQHARRQADVALAPLLFCSIVHLLVQYAAPSSTSCGLWNPSDDEAWEWYHSLGFQVDELSKTVLLTTLLVPLSILLVHSLLNQALPARSSSFLASCGTGRGKQYIWKSLVACSGGMVALASFLDSIATKGLLGGLFLLLLGMRWIAPLSPYVARGPRILQGSAAFVSLVGLYARQIPYLKGCLRKCLVALDCIGFPEVSPGWKEDVLNFGPHLFLIVALAFEAYALEWVQQYYRPPAGRNPPWAICTVFDHGDSNVSMVEQYPVPEDVTHTQLFHSEQLRQLHLQYRTIHANLKVRVNFFWELYGLGALKFCLLIGAMLIVNVISLIYLALLATLVLAGEQRASKFSLRLVLPVLGLVFAWQYVLYTRCYLHCDIDSLGRVALTGTDGFSKEWLAMTRPGAQYICVYFCAFAFCLHQCFVKLCCKRFGVRAPSFSSHGWMPLSYQWKERWTWLDRLRFMIFRHSVDLMLLATFAFSTCERDVIHGGYLAITFWFFRRRESLRQQKNSLYWYLRAYNFFVIFVGLAYQAPHGLVNRLWFGEGSDCNMQHILGLYGMAGFGSCFRISAQGMWPDFCIFTLASLQACLFSLPTYVDAMQCLREGRIATAAKINEARQEWKSRQVAAALERVSAARTHRMQVRKLKAGVRKFSSTPGDGEGSDFQLASLTADLPSRKRAEKKRKVPSFLLLPSSGHSMEAQADDSLSGEQTGPQTLAESPSALRRITGWVSNAARSLLQNRHDNESRICNFVFVLEYLHSFSIISLPFLLASLGYAVVGSPRTKFWVLMLVYAEVLLLAQYAFGIPCTLRCFECESGGPDMALTTCLCRKLDWLGLQDPQGETFFLSGNWSLMIVYLSILFHEYSLARRGHALLDPGAEDEFADAGAERGEGDTGVEILGGREEGVQGSHAIIDMNVGYLTKIVVFMKRIMKRTELDPYYVYFSATIPEASGSSDAQCFLTEFDSFLTAHGYSKEQRCIESLLLRDLQQEGTTKFSALVEVIPRPSYFYMQGCSFCPALDFASSLQSFAVASSNRSPVEAKGASTGQLLVGEVQQVSRPASDTYALCFLFDSIFFVFVTITYQRAMHNTQSLVQSVYQQLFPYDFVFSLLVIFCLIVLERAAYVTRSHFSKTLLHYFNLALFTTFCFVTYWGCAPFQRKFVVIAYAFKCASMAFSARQLHCGYPKVTANYFFMHRVDYMTSYVFMVYYSVPFIHELRSILDWTCTETSLKLIDWMKLEDIRMTLFSVKAGLLSRRNRCVGDKQPLYMKFFSGAVLFFIVCLVIWLPLMFYSTGNPSLLPNPVQDISINATLFSDSGEAFNLFQGGAQHSIQFWDGLQYKDSASGNTTTKFPLALAEYLPEQVQVACVAPDADFLWLASPPLVKGVLNASHGSLSLHLGWTFTRQRPPDNRLLSVSVAHNLSVGDKEDLRQMLEGNASVSMELPQMFGAFLHLPGEGTVELGFLQQKLPWMINCTLSLLREGWKVWWRMPCSVGNPRELPTDLPRDANLSINGCAADAGPVAIVVSERAPAGALGEAVGRVGIIGLYATFVLAVGRFLRLAVSDLQKQILFQDLPDVSRIEALIQEIDAARAAGDSALEEELYWTIVRIYRTPALLYELTLPTQSDRNILPWALGSPKLKRD